MQISLPNLWTPRHYQLKAFAKFDQGIKRQLLIWPRRSGKDSFSINLAAKAAHQRVGTIFHMLPTSRQGRKVIWDGIDKQGRRIIDQAIPPQLRKDTGGLVNDEMIIRLKNGSVYQVVGSDNYDALVGTNPIGLIISEWAISNPKAWDYLRPILTENGGFVIFISTPRGKNHMWKQLQLVKDNPDWFVSHLNYKDTGHISDALIEAERSSGMPEARLRQEYFCSFEASDVGQIYNSYVEAARASERVGSFDHDPRYPVETAWDLGHRDATAVIFVQRIQGQIRIIDYHEERKKDFGHHAKLVLNKPYIYERHVLPHDAEKIEYGSGTTVRELAQKFGMPTTIAPKLSVEAGIEATRTLFPMLRFNANKVASLLTALAHYQYDYEEDEEGRTLSVSPKPLHDWSSHPCDALRYLAVTPEGQGILPGWARQYMQSPMVGHNGGPPLEEEFDPLREYRAGREMDRIVHHTMGY
jgi:hypothetical protein